MAIIKDVTVKINNGTATLDTPVQFYEKDHDVELRFKLMDYKYKYDKDPQNILNSVDDDVLEAYTTIVNPSGYELEQINGVVKNDVVIFRLDPTYTDELDELGTYKLQIHIKCTHSEFTIPPITFEVLERLKGIKVVTDGEDEVDNSEILDNSSKFVSDETGKLIIEWKKGDMISSAKLNAMVDVINDAVDEEVIRQANEKERERKAANKIQELENTRVEYINKIDTELDSFADQVDESMTDYETRFNALTVSQQQDAEVIDARDGEQTLRARLERDIEKAKQVYINVEGSNISTDSSVGYAKDIEILGNTIQSTDLANIRSVGDKIEGQELYKIDVVSCGKNLLKDSLVRDFTKYTFNETYNSIGFKVEKGKSYIVSLKLIDSFSKNDITNTYFSVSDYCNPADPTQPKYHHLIHESEYIPQITPITSKDGYIYLCLFNQTGNTKDIFDKLMKNIEYIQLEEGTQSTPYETHQEDKLTILSPVQLEKVGDVADRIICKDGVWGVEKNIKTIQLNTTTCPKKYSSIVYENGVRLNLTPPTDALVGVTILNGMSNIYYIVNKESDLHGIMETGTRHAGGITKDSYLRIFLYNISTEQDGFDFVNSSEGILKYITTQPQFIPLPHSQQVKLRTFASKTNIHFETEIEGTIKAQVPKSLGATVNTHTEQINNLNKELDRVKKLEESTVSTVTTESNFTTVEETSNGYFEDVKLEGRTIKGEGLITDISIGHCDTTTGESVLSKTRGLTLNYREAKPNTEYTISCSVVEGKSRYCYLEFDAEGNRTLNSAWLTENPTKKITTKSTTTRMVLSIVCDDNSISSQTLQEAIDLYKPLIVEGDRVNNLPILYYGLKSVGDGVDEISVVSTDSGNIWDGVLEYGSIGAYTGIDATSTEHNRSKNYIYVIEDLDYYVNIDNISEFEKIRLIFYKYEGEYHSYMDVRTSYVIKIPKGVSCMRFVYQSSEKIYNISITKGSEPKEYQPSKQDKKSLLYYNPTTSTWEKPILREWDSIEKHSNGKYYYHKRSVEVVLNGSGEHIYNNYGTNFNGSCISFRVKLKNIIPKNGALCISDYGFILNSVPTQISNVFNDEYIHFMNNGNLYLTIQKDKLTSLDSAGVSALFTKNPIKLVFELDQEEVYECTNIDLITYENETNYIINAGAIAPKSTLKVMSNIGNVVRELQQKISNLENYIQHVMIDALNNALNE